MNLNFILTRPDKISTAGIILWWECRRLLYNLIVGIAGTFTVATFVSLSWVNSHGDYSLHQLFGILFYFVLFYGIAANLLYTSGWISELILRALFTTDTSVFSRAAFIVGTVVSVILTLLPSFFFMFMRAFS